MVFLFFRYQLSPSDLPPPPVGGQPGSPGPSGEGCPQGITARRTPSLQRREGPKFKAKIFAFCVFIFLFAPEARPATLVFGQSATARQRPLWPIRSPAPAGGGGGGGAALPRVCRGLSHPSLAAGRHSSGRHPRDPRPQRERGQSLRVAFFLWQTFFLLFSGRRWER